LHWAAHDGHCSAINLLIHSRADVNASAGDGGTSRLCLAVFLSHAEQVHRCILRHSRASAPPCSCCSRPAPTSTRCR
jgi:hypothetical protein